MMVAREVDFVSFCLLTSYFIIKTLDHVTLWVMDGVERRGTAGGMGARK